MKRVTDGFRKLSRTLREHGPFKTLLLIVKNVSSPLVLALRPGERRLLRAHREFDEKHGVSTAGEAFGGLGFPADLAPRLHGYQAVRPDVFHAIMNHLPVEDVSRFTFVDLGSGKGRACFLAAYYPFRRIVGVELSRPLHEIAVANLARYENPEQYCERIELVHADVLSYELPHDPLVLYLFNPFDASLVERLAERLRGSLEERPRELFVIYVNAQHGDVLERAAPVRSILVKPLWSIYSPRGRGGPTTATAAPKQDDLRDRCSQGGA